MSYTLKMHRVFSAPPERVYRAFVHPDALAKWLAPHGFIAKVEHAEVKPGGSYKTTFTNFSTGTQHHFHGIYHEVIPNQLLRYTDQFSTPDLQGEIEVTIIFEKSLNRYRFAYYSGRLSGCGAAGGVSFELAGITATPVFTD